MKPLPIRSIQATSLAKIIAVYYGFAGTFTTMVYMLEQPDKLSAPIGLLLPYLSLKITLTYNRAESIPGITLQVWLFMLAYAISGWLSGYLGGIVYNLLSKFLGIQVKGNVDPAQVTGVNPNFVLPVNG